MPKVFKNDVFVNCPFDDDYQPLFHALFFAVVACGFRVRCALEVDDGAQVRIDKIFNIIRESPFGIHDICRTELNPNGLPRFNMPLELGLFLGAKQFGGASHKEKRCLILDCDKFRYHEFISDIAGQDIQAHGNDPETLIAVVRNWLRGLSPDRPIPGGTAIHKRYLLFLRDFPDICHALQLEPNEVTYADYADIVTVWVRNNSP
jgi:hypothetical protein